MNLKSRRARFPWLYRSPMNSPQAAKLSFKSPFEGGFRGMSTPEPALSPASSSGDAGEPAQRELRHVRAVLWHACLAVLVLLAGFPAHAAEDRAQAQFDFANGLFHHGMFEEAVEEYETFLARHAGHPDAPLARYRLGEAAYAAGRYEKALEAFDALEAGAGEAVEGLRPQARLSKGEVLVFLDRFEEARELL